MKGDILEQHIEIALKDLLTIWQGPNGPNHKLLSIERINIISTTKCNSNTNYLIKIESDNPSLTLGKYIPFDNSSWNGFNISYARGYIHSYLKSVGQINNQPSIFIEVIPKLSTKLYNQLYRCINLQEALKKGLIEDGSEFHDTMINNNLRYVFVAGNVISGPSIAMIKFLKKYLQSNNPKTVIDLFAGSCALSLVAMNHNISRIIAIDRNIDTIIKNFIQQNSKGSIELTERNIFESVIDLDCDLIVADPFYGFADKFLELYMSQILSKKISTILNLGFIFYKGYQEKLINSVKKHTDNIEVVSICNENILFIHPK